MAGLTGQLRQLTSQLFDHVIDAKQVRFGVLQLQLGFVPALIETCDTSGIFQNAAARFGLGVDQFRNLALTHQRGRCRTRGRIGEQHLNVTGTHIFAVGLIGGAHIAGDAADDFQLVLIVEPCGRKAIRVVDGQRDFGKVTGRAAGGTGKDHVFHAAATHRGRAVFAHHPAQRLKQVGLAAAVRTHDTGQPFGNDQIRRINEAFEACKFESRKAQMAPRFLIFIKFAGPKGAESNVLRIIWLLSAGYPQDIGHPSRGDDVLASFAAHIAIAHAITRWSGDDIAIKRLWTALSLWGFGPVAGQPHLHQGLIPFGPDSLASSQAFNARNGAQGDLRKGRQHLGRGAQNFDQVVFAIGGKAHSAFGELHFVSAPIPLTGGVAGCKQQAECERPLHSRQTAATW